MATLIFSMTKTPGVTSMYTLRILDPTGAFAPCGRHAALRMARAERRPEMRAYLGRFVRHLRLQFQFILAPIFLLGYEFTDAPPTLSFLFLFLLIHVGLYGGATAYNSYYDRDEGPIGGMKHSLAVDTAELYGGLFLQALALLGLLWWSVNVFLGG